MFTEEDERLYQQRMPLMFPKIIQEGNRKRNKLPDGVRRCIELRNVFKSFGDGHECGKERWRDDGEMEGGRLTS